MWVWLLIGLDILTKVHGFSNGNNPQSCNTLSPQHQRRDGGLFTAQTSAAPFAVDYERNSNPGDPITIVLRSTESTTFRGFMLEAREAAQADSGPPVGKFILLDTGMTRLLTCNGIADSAVSQNNNQDKDLIRVNWTATEINQEVIFRATFLQSFTTFWENVKSPSSLPTTTPVPSTTTSTTAASTTTNTPEPSTVTNTPEPSTTTNTPTTSPPPPPTPTRPPPPNILERVGAALMCVDCMLEELKMEMPNIFAVLLAKGTSYHRLSEMLQKVMSTVCLGFEITSLVLFCAGDSCNVILVGLACVVIVINFLEQVIWSLTIRNILTEQIGGIAVKVGFVVHQGFALSILYVAVLADRGKNRRAYWPLNVLIAFTVWISLAVVWNLVFTTQKKAIRRTVEQVALRSDDRFSQQSQKKNHIAVRQVIVIAVFVSFFLGTTSLAIAVIVGIAAGSQGN